MPSEKLTAILRSKSGFSEAEIATLSEAEGWRWVYENKPRAKDSSHEICFTGFGLVEREELEALARGLGFKVKESVTTTLAFLCTGENPGPAKVEKARKRRVTILNREQFFELLQNGTLPE